MKNLKKALVLVLAFAMVFSLFTFNASAASFADDEDIVNKEAVETMVQLGIINGYEDGTFLPKQVVTRAEMCKMISVAMTGGNLPLLEGTSLFSDTAGHWANSYINYCYNKGIVSGDSGKGGTFRPDAAVTGIEAAKMMLVAIGYNSTLAGFTGPDWAINVASAASDKNLFEGLGTLNAYAGLTRDNAAQLIYNGIRADMVEYTSTLTTDPNGQLTSTPTLKNRPGVTMLTDRFGVSVLEGYIVSSEYATIGTANATNTAGETTMYVRTKGATTVNKTFILKTSTPADMVGKAVKVYVKDSSLVGNTYNTVFGAPVVTSNNRVKTFTGAAYTDVSDFTAALKAVGINGFADTVTKSTNNGYAIDKGAYTPTTANELLGRGKEVTFIDNNNDGLVDVIRIMQKYVGKVTVLNAAGNSGKGTITVSTTTSAAAPLPADALSAKTYDVVYGEENLALNDYVLFYVLNGKYYVEKATSTTATVSKVTPNATTAANGTVTAGGVTYRQSALVNNVNGSAVLAAAAKLGENTVFYFDNYGNVVAIKAATSAGKYLVVTDIGTPDPLAGLQVRVVNEEGVVSVVYLDSITTAAGNKISTTGSLGNDDGKDMEDALSGTHQGGDYKAGNEGGDPTYDPKWQANKDTTIFTYTVKDNGKYVLTVPTTGTIKWSDNAGAVNTSNPELGGSLGTANANTVFVVKTGTTTYTKYVGVANVVTVASAKALTYQKSSSTAVDIAFFLSGKITSSSTSGVFICSTAYSEVLDGSTKVYEYPAIIDGVATTITATSNSIFTSVGYYDTITLNSKGQYTDARINAAYGSLVPVTTVGNGVINGYIYDDSVKVFEISSSGAVTESAIGNIYDGRNGTIASNVVIVPKGNSAPNDTIAKYVFVCGNAKADAPTSIKVTPGGGTLAVDNDDFIVGGFTRITASNAAKDNTLTIAVTKAEKADSYSIAITSSAADNAGTMTGGTDAPAVWTLGEGDIGKELTVVVTCKQKGRLDWTATYKITVEATPNP